MNRFLLFIAIAASLSANNWQAANCQEKSDVQSSEDRQKTTARKILEDAKQRALPIVKDGTKQAIEEKEIQLNAIRPRAEQMRRDMRYKDVRSGVTGGIESVTGKRAGDDAELAAREEDIASLTASIKKLNDEQELNVLKTAWLLLNHEDRCKLLQVAV